MTAGNAAGNYRSTAGDKRYTVLALERKDDCMNVLRFLKTVNPAIVVYYEIPAKPLTLAELPEYE